MSTTYPIRTFLDVSTAHLTAPTREWLAVEIEKPDHERAVGPMGAMPHGWFIYVPPELDATEYPNVPDDLRDALRKAHSLGCDYVLFDSDAATIEGLQAFE